MTQEALSSPPIAHERSSAEAAERAFEQLYPEAASRRVASEALADAIVEAAAANAGSWSVTLEPGIVRLNVGQPEVLVLFNGGLHLWFDGAELGRAERRELGDVEDLDEEALPEARSIRVNANDFQKKWPLLRERYVRLVREAAQNANGTAYRSTHSPGVLRYLRTTLARELPDPNYGAAPSRRAAASAGSLLDQLRSAMLARDLQFTDHQLATFFTALQVKGFVILSGISGTGKTKLAQRFAELMPSGAPSAVDAEDDARIITVQPYMLKYNRLVVPRRILDFVEYRSEQSEVMVRFPGGENTCRVGENTQNKAFFLMLRGAARTWFEAECAVGKTFVLETEVDPEGNLTAFRLSLPQPRTVSGQPNWLFVPVRPDWRDSKSVLGYFNPLTRTSESTQLLRFILRAADNYRTNEPTAWFLILDEMNLAHVEHYFADVLSVLESGRDDEGWTREPLRCEYPPEAEGELPPREIKLPPNLYIVGTVNIDETTHAFSLKVLDRAFALEMTEANFDGYMESAAHAEPRHRPTEVLREFSMDGRFAGVDKGVVRAHLREHPDLRSKLNALNTSLQPYNLHFGYRVFDEIVAFLAAAAKNRLFTGQGAEAAFDAAVLMKVLPKFHGSRAKLEDPLLRVLAWCQKPAAPQIDPFKNILEHEDALAIRAALDDMTFELPATAKRCTRMLYALHTDGFAAFG